MKIYNGSEVKILESDKKNSISYIQFVNESKKWVNDSEIKDVSEPKKIEKPKKQTIKK